MADERYRQDYRQQGRPEEHQSRPASQNAHPQHPQHPPPPDSHGLAEVSRASMAASVTLPPIHDSRPPYGAPPPGPPSGRGYPTDPRYAGSPHSAVNGYPPPGGQQPPPPPPQHHQHPPPPPHHQQQAQGQGYLPPLQPQGDPRSPYPQQDQRGGYYDQRPPPGYPEQYPQEAYYYRGPPGQGPPPNGFSRDYRGPPGYPEFGQPNNPTLTQAAPRQRTSIACRYCRKRKIRCSGYQSAPGGKCQNCARMNQECIFQPVSSSSSTAFIPVSAVPGGVPPGTQLFGAYGEPLHSPYGGPPPPHGQHGPPPPGPYPGHYAPQQAQHGPHPGPYFQQPLHSPTESYSSHGDQRSEENGQVAGQRRRRTSEEQDDGYRLPPPRAGGQEEDHRRRSPAEMSNHSSPSGLPYHPYPGPRQSPRNPTLPMPPTGGNHPAPGGVSPSVKTGSSGASTPARPAGAAGGTPQQGGSSVMSLSNLVDKNDIDKTMIDRLNRPRDR